MKVNIDREDCIECGLCASTCPDVFVIASGEKASIVETYRTIGPGKGEIRDDLTSCAKEAADSCPVSVINIK
jgi:ferredoxin